MARLGKRERSQKRELHQFMRSHVRSVVDSNQRNPTKETSRGYAKVGDYQANMTHGLYRGLYDPGLSSDKDTGRGFAKLTASQVKRGVKLRTD